MKPTNINERNQLIDVDQPDSPQLATMSGPAAPLLGSRPVMPATSGADESQSDHGLNRIIAMSDSLNTDNFTEIECLEMLFYLSSKKQDARLLAEAAINIYGSLAKVFQRPSKELRDMLGIDYAMTAMISVAKSSMKYIIAPGLPDRRKIESYPSLIDYLALDLREAEQEILRIIYLDKKNTIIRDEETGRGTVDTVSIYPREIARRALTYCASSVILAHNHLSDDPTPSNSDIGATVQTKRALQFIDIVLHDHVIISRNQYFSMQQHSLI